tara:strand:- start:77724 stop:79580 length:1857 start_codon:yes stop_codon:yes gene_type:complete
MYLRNLSLMIIFATLLSCSASGPQTAQRNTDSSPVATIADSSLINQYLATAADLESPEAEEFLLRAATIAISDADADTAAAILNGIDDHTPLPLHLQARTAFLYAEIAMLRNTPQSALIILNGSPFEQQQQLDDQLRADIMELRSRAYMALGQFVSAAREHTRMVNLLPVEDRVANIDRIWEILSAAPAPSLRYQASQADSYELRGWLELTNVVNARQDNIEQQVDAIRQWQNRWNQHSAAARLPAALAFIVELLATRPQHVALLIPLSEAAGRAVSEGFLAAFYDAVKQGQQVPQVSIHDTSGISDVTTLYRLAVERGADLVIGPLRKESVRQLQRQQRLAVPTLALNYGDEDRLNPAGFYQFGLAPEDEIRQIARTAWQSGHRSASVLTPDGQEYQRIQQVFTDAWQALGGTVINRTGFGDAADYPDTIARMLNTDASQARADQLLSILPRNNMEFIPRRRQDIDFIFMQANPAEGRQLKPTLGFHFAGDVPVYAMPAIYDGGRGASNNRDLNGIIFVDAPWILTANDPLQAQTLQAWPANSAAVQRLRAMGVDAYRLHARLAQMSNFPGIRIQGATGVLGMQANGSITRELLPARIVNGAPELIAQTPSSALTAN